MIELAFWIAVWLIVIVVGCVLVLALLGYMFYTKPSRHGVDDFIKDQEKKRWALAADRNVEEQRRRRLREEAEKA